MLVKSVQQANTRLIRQYSTDSIKIIKTVPELRQWRLNQLKNSKKVGLVPTMGALHRGHLDLVRASLGENDSTVVSIFVNPSQFAPHEDLSTYPRTLDDDLSKLRSVLDQNQLTVFLPGVEQMYPTGISLDRSQQKGAFVEVKGLSEQLEGSIRPHFFRGVATVVAKLLNISTPDKAYFGQKDIQQSVVIKRLVKDLIIPTEIAVVPTAREENGLAMSSRNEYLTPESKAKAGIFYEALSAGEKVYYSSSSSSRPVSRKAILDPIYEVLNKYAPKEQQDGNDKFFIEIEYVALSDKETLLELDTVEPGVGGIISAAIRVPNKSGSMTRIIDNIVLS